MIQGNDGGVYVTENGAKSWRFLNNLPIEQFYMVSASSGDSPYMLCGGLQDNNAWCGPSSGVPGPGAGRGWAGWLVLSVGLMPRRGRLAPPR